MGELHSRNVICPIEHVTVSQFVLTPLLTNPNSDFVVESSSSLKNLNLGSTNIAQILTNVNNSTILKANDVQNRIKYIEFRREFLSTNHPILRNVSSFLYNGYNTKIGKNGISVLYYITLETLKQGLIDPFFDYNNQVKFQTLYNAVEPNIAQAITAYKNRLTISIKDLQEQIVEHIKIEVELDNAKNLAEEANKNNYAGMTLEMKEDLISFDDYVKFKTELIKLKLHYIQELKKIWAEVNNSLCLPIIFDTRQTQIFILVGLAHSENFKEILYLFKQNYNIPIEMILDSQSRDGCIKILKAVNIYSANLQDTLNNSMSSEELITPNESEAIIYLLLLQQGQGEVMDTDSFW